jgi:hypothetical protein
MSEAEMTAIVQKQLDAYNRRAIDDFVECFHSEVQVRLMLSERVSLEGREDYRENYRKLFEDSPQLHCQLKSRVVLDSVVIDEELVTGIRGSKEGLHIIAIYAFRDGLIDRVWFPK